MNGENILIRMVKIVIIPSIHFSLLSWFKTCATNSYLHFTRSLLFETQKKKGKRKIKCGGKFLLMNEVTAREIEVSSAHQVSCSSSNQVSGVFVPTPCYLHRIVRYSFNSWIFFLHSRAFYSIHLSAIYMNIFTHIHTLTHTHKQPCIHKNCVPSPKSTQGSQQLEFQW